MKRERSDRDDMPDWIWKLLDRTGLTKLGWRHLRKHDPRDAIKDLISTEPRAAESSATILDQPRRDEEPFAEAPGFRPGARVVLRSGSSYGTVTSMTGDLLNVQWDDGTFSTISPSQLGNRDEL
jgi:hypothetical protein